MINLNGKMTDHINLISKRIKEDFNKFKQTFFKTDNDNKKSIIAKIKIVKWFFLIEKILIPNFKKIIYLKQHLMRQRIVCKKTSSI